MKIPFDSTPIYYVYVLKHSDTLRPFYVGKGQGNRMYRHERDTRNHQLPNKTNGHLYRELKAILDSGKRPVYEIAQDNLTETEAFALEVALIEDIGLENLCNCVLFSPNSQTKSRGKLGYKMAEVEKVRHKETLNSAEVKLKCGYASYKRFVNPNGTHADYLDYKKQRNLKIDLKLLNVIMGDIRRKLVVEQKALKPKRTAPTPWTAERMRQYGSVTGDSSTGVYVRLCPNCGAEIKHKESIGLRGSAFNKRVCAKCKREHMKAITTPERKEKISRAMKAYQKAKRKTLKGLC